MNTVTENLQLINERSLAELANSESECVLTLTMETHERGHRTQQDPIRYKNLLAQAAEKAAEQIGTGRLPDDLIENLSAKQSDEDFWQHQRSGLAIFCDQQSIRFFSTRHRLPEIVRIDPYPQLTHLVPDLKHVPAAFVLTLGWELADLKIFEREELPATSEADFPLAIEDLVWPRDPETQLQYASHQSRGIQDGSRTAMYHGHGKGEGKIEADRRNFLSRVGDLVAATVYHDSLPLVVVGTSEVIGHFESATDVKINVRIAANPAALEPKELHQRIRDGLDNYGVESVRDVKQAISAAISADRVARDVEQIATAAIRGRVDRLLFRQAGSIHGTVDQDAQRVSRSPKQGTHDLVNAAVVHTLRRGGQAHRCQPEILADAIHPAIAVLRF